jgi:hypothetical protein
MILPFIIFSQVLIDSLVSTIKYILREICLCKRWGLLEGPYIRHCPKVAPSFIDPL